MKLRPLRPEGVPLSVQDKQLFNDLAFDELNRRSILWRDVADLFAGKNDEVRKLVNKRSLYYANLSTPAIYVAGDIDKAYYILKEVIEKVEPVEPTPADYLATIEQATAENLAVIKNPPLSIAAQIEKLCLYDEQKLPEESRDPTVTTAAYLFDKSIKSYSNENPTNGQSPDQIINQPINQTITESMTPETSNSQPIILTEPCSIESFSKEPQASEEERLAAEFEQNFDCIFKVLTADEWFDEAAALPDQNPLYKTLWIEGEVSCLFADTNIGKSILAVQIAEEVAKKKKVLYFDFEMSTKQFERRYTNAEGVRHSFSSNFERVELAIENLNPMYELEDVIIKAIECLAIKRECSTIIIDNLTYLCNDNASGDLAGKLMMRLIELKKLHAWSILVLAHTPKRALDSPLTQNDLAGSKKLINFFDSAFAIGKSASDDSMRYLKHIKSRWGEKVYSADNVLRMEITTDDGWLHFEERGTISEDRLLKKPEEKEREATAKRIGQLHAEGLSTRKIAAQVGLSHMQVSRIIKKL